jgi:hypothetical protein
VRKQQGSAHSRRTVWHAWTRWARSVVIRLFTKFI